MTALEAIRIIQEYFPTASDDIAQSILWTCTGWPAFWRTDDVEQCIREDIDMFAMRSNCNPYLAMKFADMDMDRVMAGCYEKEINNKDSCQTS